MRYKVIIGVIIGGSVRQDIIVLRIVNEHAQLAQNCNQRLGSS